MVSVPDTPYHDPAAWRVATEVSEWALSMNTPNGPRLLCELPGFQGTFVLRRDGLLAGFTLRLPLPESSRPPWLRTPEAPVLHWKSLNLEADPPPPGGVAGRARLRLGRRETFAPVSALCVTIPAARPYLKLVVETVFPSVALRWPAEAWPRLRPVTLRLLSEIHPVGIEPGSASIPEQPHG